MKKSNFEALAECLLLLLAVAMTIFVWAVAIYSLVDIAKGLGTETPVPEAAVTAADYLAPPNQTKVDEEVKETEEEIDHTRLEQLAIGIYREAGADYVCDECRFRVGDVMLNREADSRFPDTLAEVLTQKGQYGTMYWEGITWPERASNPEEAHAVQRAYRTAEEILRGEHSELYGQGYIFQSEFPDLGTEAVECCGIYYAKG